jgi:hypothetical protein
LRASTRITTTRERARGVIMSKRGAGAGFGRGEERYGGDAAMDANDKPMQATQAQMARRK